MKEIWRGLTPLGIILIPAIFVYGAYVVSTEFGNLYETIISELYSATQASLSALAANDFVIIDYLNRINGAAILEYNSNITNLKLDKNRSLHHAKFLLTNDSVVFGSMNFTESSLKDDLNDAIVFCEPEILKVFENIFSSLWNGKKPQGVYKTRLGDFYISPFFDLEKIFYKILDAANNEVDIAVYAFTDMNIFGSLKYLSSRGVKIKIVMDDWSERYIGRYPLDQFEVKISKNTTLHHKFIIVDGKILITGSANFTESGFRKNFEMIFVTKNRRIIQEYERIFDALWR